MTRNDVVDLLSAITAYDNRNATAETVMAWTKSAELGRWTLPEALDAVHEHFATSTEFLMPAHVTTRVKASRADAALREPLVHPDPIGQKRVQELISNAFAAITPPGTEEANAERRSALARACPYCSARPGEPCTRSGHGGPVRLTQLHPSRSEAAAS